MATTPEGKSWITKALHPSDPITTIRGLPDESSGPSVVLSYYNVFRISAPIAQTSGTWGFDITIMPNLLVPIYYVKVDSSGGATAAGNYFNMSFAPPGVVSPSYLQCLGQLAALGLESHRMIACGITAYQDGPALANQGTITAAQWDVARRKYTNSSFTNAPSGASIAANRIVTYQANDFANYDFSQHLPNAYFAESKEGCYMPLRLTRTSQKWISEADLEFVGDPALPQINGNLVLPAASAGFTRHAAPFPDIQPAYFNDIPGTNYGGIWGDQVFAPLNGTWGGISCRNLSYQTSFAFYIRQVIEARVTPTSLLAPQVQMSPPYDPQAIASYFRINRELKDAYPADFNDLGKIWDVIKSAAKVALPFLSAVPGPVGMVGKAGSAILGGLEGISNASKMKMPSGSGTSGTRGRGRDRPSAAAIDRAQKVEAAKETLAQMPKRPTTRSSKKTRRLNVRRPSQQ